jgi:hypothetical protein
MGRLSVRGEASERGASWMAETRGALKAAATATTAVEDFIVCKFQQ